MNFQPFPSRSAEPIFISKQTKYQKTYHKNYVKKKQESKQKKYIISKSDEKVNLLSRALATHIKL